MPIGPVRVSTNDQDLTAQKNALAALGVSVQKTFTDQGLTGTNRARPGLREGMQVAKAAGRLRGKQPKLSPAQEKYLVEVHQRGEHGTAQISSGPPDPRSTGQFNEPGTPPPKRSLGRGVGVKRACCAGEYRKAIVHTHVHNPENTMAVVQTTSENDNDRASNYRDSSSASPWPPPPHRATAALPVPRRDSSRAACRAMRPPLEPIG